MIPICLVTGFLGSGKTTFLRRLVERHGGERIVYLVNEFSPHDVDGVLLEEVEEDVLAIPGGSIFCKCLVTQFIGMLQTIPERFGGNGEPLRGVVIEASGIANPMVIEQMLAETGLDEIYELATVVSVVDPGSLPKLVRTLPNIRAQIEAADTLLLNKIDLFTADEVAEAERIAREINAEAPVIRTVRCAADVALFEARRPRGLEGEYAPCVDPNYRRFAISFEGPVDLAALTRGLEGLRDEIYRAKGFVPTADGTVYLDMSAAQLTIEEADDRSGSETLAVIAHGDASDGVQEMIQSLARI